MLIMTKLGENTKLMKKTEPNFLNELVHLERACFVDHAWSYEQIISHHREQSSYLYFVENRVVSYLIFLENPYETEILRVGTVPDFRRQGLAKEILQRFLDLVYPKPVLLEVSKTNQPAIELYSNLNFQQIGIRRNYYANGDSAMVMKFLPRESN